MQARLPYYNFNIEYCRGDQNVIADALSHLPVRPETEPVVDEEKVPLVSVCIQRKNCREVPRTIVFAKLRTIK